MTVSNCKKKPLFLFLNVGFGLIHQDVKSLRHSVISTQLIHVMELPSSNICILGRIYDYTPIIPGKYTPNEKKDGARVYSTIKQNILLFTFVSVKIKIKSNIHIPLSSSVSMISAGSVWRNGKSTAHQREAIIDAPAMRSSSRWRSSQRR